MIVCGTREIAARLYDAIVERRPDWHSDAVDQGVIKVVYSGSASDTEPISKHVRRGSENDVIKNRLRDVDDPLQLVIVKDMMLTGYDSPPLHTLYLDRPLKGALLMQTLARVNRTFRGKQAGLLVGYAPLADNLRDALGEYSDTDQAEKPMGKEVGEAAELAKVLIAQLDAATADYDWRGKLLAKWKYVKVTTGLANHLRAQRPAPAPRAGRGRRGREHRRPVPPAQHPARPRLGVGVGHRGAGHGVPRGALLRRGPGLHGQVRRRGASSQRPSGARGDPAPARRRDRGEHRVRRGGRHLRGGRDAATAAERPHPGVPREGPAVEQRAPGHRGAAQPGAAGVDAGDAQQPGAGAHLQRAGGRADAQVRQRQPDRRRGDRRAGRPRQGGRRRGQARARSSTRRWAPTSSPSSTPSPRTSPRST